jgi:hypothetical protein
VRQLPPCCFRTSVSAVIRDREAAVCSLAHRADLSRCTSIVPPHRAAHAAPFYFGESVLKVRRRLTQARLRELLRYDPNTGQFRWRKRPSPSVRKGAIAGGVSKFARYWCITIDGRTYMAHQLAWLYRTGKWCRPMVDHRDGDRTNNRWRNLRRATSSQNNANRCVPRNNRCGFKGVGLKAGRWCARIRKNGRLRELGAFPTPQAAHAAYVAAARKLFGEFARAE